jgi:phage tail-like protein
MRAAVDDLMQGFRFHVKAVNKLGLDPLQPIPARGDGFEGGGVAGFQSVTLPELSIEATEYREGTFTWTQKYPGPPTVSDCTLMRGVSKTDTAFFDWVMGSVNGAEYRSDVTIYHYQRTEMGNSGPTPLQGPDQRAVFCKNCIPTRVKPAADFDSMSGEVSLAEVDFAMESFELLVA